MSRTQFGGWENDLRPETINSFRQDSPELIIRDARILLKLNDEQLEMLRKILLARGVNKWLKARRDIINLKHKIKKSLFSNNGQMTVHDIYCELQRICHSPRWVEWPRVKSPVRADGKWIVKGPKS